jgi:hypothetical protein
MEGSILNQQLTLCYYSSSSYTMYVNAGIVAFQVCPLFTQFTIDLARSILILHPSFLIC